MSAEQLQSVHGRNLVRADGSDHRQSAVSVTMPAYNAERYISKAIESILGQDYTDFELIIIDDGSTDSTPAIIQRYAASDPRIRWRSRPNRGIVATRRELLHMCRGRYLAILDSDDVALPGRLARTVGHLESNPDCLAVGGAVEVIDADGDVICSWAQPPDHDTIDARMLGAPGLFMAASTTTMRTEWILKSGGYDPTAITSAEDLDLLLRLAEHGRLANLPETLAQYRLHFANESMASRQRQYEQRHRIVGQALARRGLSRPQEPFAPPAPESRVQTHIKWAWWAISSSHPRTALKHAWKAVCHNPFSTTPWRCLLHAGRATLRSTAHERGDAA